MNVYDFDKTIYDGDSTVDFYVFSLRNKPALIRYLPIQIYGIFLYKIKKIDKTQMKQMFFSFLKGIDETELYIKNFWDKNFCKIKKWYIRQKKEDDLVISASPDFLISPVCLKLSIKEPIATDVDKKTGKINGKNCKGEEKVKMFKKTYGKEKIEKFYSDSVSDTPLAKLAEKAYLVKKNKIFLWKLDL